MQIIKKMPSQLSHKQNLFPKNGMLKHVPSINSKFQNTVQSLTFETLNNILIFLPVAVEVLPDDYSDLIQSKPRILSQFCEQEHQRHDSTHIVDDRSNHPLRKPIQGSGRHLWAGNNSAYSITQHNSNNEDLKGSLNAQNKLTEIHHIQ